MAKKGKRVVVGWFYQEPDGGFRFEQSQGTPILISGGGKGSSSREQKLATNAFKTVISMAAAVGIGLGFMAYKEYRDRPELRGMTPDQLMHELETNAPQLKQQIKDNLKEEAVKQVKDGVLSENEPADESGTDANDTNDKQPAAVASAPPAGEVPAVDMEAASVAVAVAGAEAGTIAANEATRGNKLAEKPSESRPSFNPGEPGAYAGNWQTQPDTINNPQTNEPSRLANSNQQPNQPAGLGIDDPNTMLNRLLQESLEGSGIFSTIFQPEEQTPAAPR